ncbi:efflux RND transporter permease subunit [Halosquirtibacter xylanolyticus]|uniref:efflux RND transporter permease subunit n=1 Tax=Halosquirtibacter xylanolyticus TaxID=3374599 RepID=UPI00374888DF|nr:efflux RND transporter permease subunit [Prolixibacteraceae bacterium]
MRKLVSEFVKYPFYANLIIIFLLIGGIVSYKSMKKSFFPEVSSRNIYVSVFYPGASPVEMEEGVTSRIEEAVRGLVGIKQITSTSSENSCSVQIETTGTIDIDETLMDVKNAVDGISSFPSAAERPIVYKQRNTSMALYISFNGDIELQDLKKYAQQVQEDFYASGVISQVSIMGYPDLEISVEVKEDDLMRYQITFDQITNAIRSNNRDMSGGQIKSQEEEVLIRFRSRSAKPNDIANIVLKSNVNGADIRIGDIAVVKRKFADIPLRFQKRGKPLVSMMVNKLNSEDLEDITVYVDDYITEFNKTHQGVAMRNEFSFMEILQSRLDLLTSNGLTGLILVLITLALFLNLRLSFWVAWGIPSSFLSMFIVANLMGLTINMISLFGMILVIGILVDDGIVIGENIFQHIERGEKPLRAAVNGTMEVVPSVLTSVITTMVAFMPLLFLKNQMETMREMAYVVILCLFFSLFEAFFVLPAHLGSSKSLDPSKREEKQNWIRRIMERFIHWLRDIIYDKYLTLSIRWRYIVIFVPIAMMIVTGAMFQARWIRTTFFPAMEFDSFTIDFAFTPGSGEKRTQEYLDIFNKAVWEVNDSLMQVHGDAIKELEPSWISKLTDHQMDTTQSFIKETFVVLGSSFNGLESGSHAGKIDCFPRNLEGLPVSSHELTNLVKNKIGSVPELQKFSIAGQSMFGKPVSLSLLSRDKEALDGAKHFLESRLLNNPKLKNVNDNNTLGKQEILLELKDKAFSLGLNEAFIANQVRQGFYGDQAQRLQSGRDELRVWVRYPLSDRERVGQLEQMRIKTPAGSYPLSELTDYHVTRGPVSIKRYDGYREVKVEADVVDPKSSVTDILTEIQKSDLVELQKRFPTVKIESQGQQKESKEAMDTVSFYYSIAFFIIVTILMIHFKSFQQPLLVLMMIPLAIIGAFWGHGLCGKPVSLLSVWGIIALTGVIINDAVVFLSTYNSNILDGDMPEHAIHKAAKSRLRAILLTTLTTSIGLYPLILEKSFQAQFLIPMAVSLAYGVAFGTLFILLFFPSLVMILNDARRASKGLRVTIKRYIDTGKWEWHTPSAREVEIVNVNAKKQIMYDSSKDVNTLVGDLDLHLNNDD